MASFIRKVVIALSRPERVLRTRLDNGAIVLGKNKPGYGGRGVYLEGDNTEPELAHLTRFLTTDSIFIDIGANTGVYSLKAAKHLIGGEVIAIEPNLEMLESLNASVRANQFRNVRLRNLCASNVLGHADFWCNDNKPNSFSLVRHDQNAERMSVITVPLDDVVKWEALKRVDYIKMDVEGAEEIVLEGAKMTIERFRPIVQFEVTIRDTKFDFPSYVGFRAEESPNCVYFPAESPYLTTARGLGWRPLS